MKNTIFLVLLTIIIITPAMVFADCSKEEINEYKNAIRNTKIGDIKYVKNANVEVEYEPSEYYEIKIENLPKYYTVIFKNDDAFATYHFNNKSLKIDVGGVFDIEYISQYCPDNILKTSSLYLPQLSETNLNNQKDTLIKQNKSKIIILIALLIAILVLIFIIILLNKRRKKNNAVGTM